MAIPVQGTCGNRLLAQMCTLVDKTSRLIEKIYYLSESAVKVQGNVLPKIAIE
jgi:hypothetical protein